MNVTLIREGPLEIERGTIHAQIDRLLKSKTLKGSEHHRKLLSYLAEKSIDSEEHCLKEYTVALEAFGKPATYDPRHDSTVRIQAARLRQKLVQYYLTEGAADPIVVDMPKGGFRLRFGPSPAATVVRDDQPSPKLARVVVILTAVALVSALWAGYTTWALSKARSQSQALSALWSPELDQIWAPILDSRRPVRLCMGTPLFAFFDKLGFFRYPWANQRSELEGSAGFEAMRKLSGTEGLSWYGFTTTGETDAAFLLGKLLVTRRPDIQLSRSHTLSWQQASENELIFLGPPKFNDQLDHLLASTDIAIEPRGIRNRKPRPGEPALMEDKYQPGREFDGESYALISLVPGLSGVGHVLILGGNASAATYAAAQWLTQPEFARQLVQRLRLPSGKLPQYYQVVLKVEFRDGIPLQSSYLLHRILQQ